MIMEPTSSSNPYFVSGGSRPQAAVNLAIVNQHLPELRRTSIELEVFVTYTRDSILRQNELGFWILVLEVA
jgi:hypothetical protein